MKPYDLLMSAFRSIGRNKTRSLLTMLGIIIGVGAVIGLMAIGQGSEESIKGELGKLGSNVINVIPARNNQRTSSRGTTRLDILFESDIAIIKQFCPSVANITPLVQSQVQAVNGANNVRPSITGVYSDYFKIQKLETQYGQLFDDDTGKSFSKVCIIGKTVAEELFQNQANAIGQIIRLNKIPFRVLGVLKAKGQSSFGMDQDNVIIAPFASVQKRILGINYANSISVSAISDEVVELAQEELKEVLSTKLEKVQLGEPTFEIMTLKEIMDVMGSITGMLTLLLAAVASISLIVGGIGIMNIMLVSVKERTREIGLRLAVGAPENAILLQFLLEAIFICLIGGILGVMVGFLIAFGGGSYLGWAVEVTPSSIALAFGFSSLIGVVFGFFPARQASRLHPIEALRYE